MAESHQKAYVRAVMNYERGLDPEATGPKGTNTAKKGSRFTIQIRNNMDIHEELLNHFLSDVTNSWEIVNGIANGDFKPEMIQNEAIRAEALLKRTKEKLEEALGLGEPSN